MTIEYSENFLKEAKKLAKKYKHLKSDLQDAVKEIEEKDLGIFIGSNLYKKRVKNSSIPTGKSGGFRVIIYQQLEDKVILISIYSKTEKDSLSDSELQEIFQKHFSKS